MYCKNIGKAAINSSEGEGQIKDNFRVKMTLGVEKQVGVCQAFGGRAAG